MKPQFEVRPTSFEDVHALPQSWSLPDFRDVLEALDFEDARTVDDSETRELCLMALSDLEPEEAARIVLRHRLGGVLKPGQIEDVSHDMVDEPVWEDYPIMSVHEELYNVNQLLYDAFQGTFPRPRAARLELAIKAKSAEGASEFDSPTDAFVVRLLAGGLGEESLLHRLFEEQVKGSSFPEASAIVWRCEHERIGSLEARCVVYGSRYWLHELEDSDDYEAVGYSDAEEDASP